MKEVLIIENSLSGLQKLNESVVNSNQKEYILGGIFTEFDVKNRNERIYTSSGFLPHLNELLERKKQLGVVYGEFDHPEVFDTSLARISHTVESLTFNEQKNTVEGTIRLLNTHYGREAKALIDDNCPIFVSSRAAGVTESNGTVSIKKLFTYDAVADPGFSSAKMELKSINESLGFNESANFRVYDITDESKINELFNMNQNDFVTKDQMVEYSNYLTEEIAKTQQSIKGHVKEGKFNPKELYNLEERYDSLQEGFKKVTEYLDYLSGHISTLITKNETLESKTGKIIEHNDYLAETLEKSVNYSEYLAESIEKGIDYSQYIAETLDKNIDFSEYIAEHVDKNIKYSEYIVENLDKSIDYSNYMAEQLDNSIVYSEYIVENVENNIKYSEYVAEHLDNNIKYAEYIAEHVDNNIKYAEYIAENVSDNIAYSNYLAESLDKSIDKKYGKLNENQLDVQNNIDFTPSDDMSKYYEDDELPQGQTQGQVQGQTQGQTQGQVQGQTQGQVQGQVQGDEDFDDVQSQVQGDEDFDDVQSQVQGDEDFEGDDEFDSVQGQPIGDEFDEELGLSAGMVVKIDNDLTGEVLATNSENSIVVIKMSDTGEVQEIQESRVTPLSYGGLLRTENTLKQNIKNFITEAKKRKASDNEEPHFLLFLTEKKKAAYYNLSQDDKEKVILTINESNGYVSEDDVIRIMEKALSTPQQSLEETLIDNIPTDLRPIWENLESNVKQSILSGSQFYTNLSESKMESFWRTRGLDKYDKVDVSRKLINETMYSSNNSKLNETQLQSYLNRLENL